jgi:dTDP-4-amino-4,6-dideoxygalactose transaminase
LLAIHGGVPVIKSKFKTYNTIGEEEITAVVKVLQTGSLSKFIGAWCDDFYGGPQVQAFEDDWQKYFGVRNAIAVNSWTSGLTAAIGAIGIEPGDEVIVSPWTMAASATSILHWNAIPVFADISLDDFCLDPKSVEAAITPYTKAIMLVDIFGQSADMNRFAELAEKHKLLLISDSAQSPGALYQGSMAGTIADIGGFSLNYHKHIHTGEGGMVVTNNDEFAERVRLIRNHAEAVVGDKGTMDLANMIGYNYRMGEIEAAIGREQLKKFPNLLISRQKAAARIINGLKNISGIRLPVESADRTHAFYVLPIVLDLEKLTVDRHGIFSALKAEGLEGIAEGYVNLHLLPMYQNKLAYGSKGFPWVSGIAHREVDYSKGICPVAEKLHFETFLEIEICRFELNDREIDLIVETFKKVFNYYKK